MLNKLIRKIRNLLNFAEDNYGLSARQEADFQHLSRELTAIKLLQGRSLENFNLAQTNALVENPGRAEFQVFSQWGDDGIINFLVNYLDIPNRTFVEFGVENYVESNTRFLLINNNWKGLVMDGSAANIAYIRRDEIAWKYNLTAIEAFVTAENINELLRAQQVEGEIGLLHIDIDGNDYWVWKSISVINPVVVVMEYNSVFGADAPWVVPYDPAFFRTQAHYSNLYAGASLPALCGLAREKGYEFVVSNRNGNNAYFVRRDKLKDLRPLSAREGYVDSQFAEARDPAGQLTYLRGDDRLAALRGLPVFNTLTNITEYI